MSEQAVVPFSGRLQKLRAMSRRELQHRVQYAAALKLERWQHARGTLAPADRLERALGSGIRGTQWRERLLASRRQALPFSVSRRPRRRRCARCSRGVSRASARRRWHTPTAPASIASSSSAASTATASEIAWQNDPVTGARVAVLLSRRRAGPRRRRRLRRRQTRLGTEPAAVHRSISRRRIFLTGRSGVPGGDAPPGIELDRRQPVRHRRQLVVRARAGVPTWFVAVGVPPDGRCARRRVPRRMAARLLRPRRGFSSGTSSNTRARTTT